jgi:hypothetical protein
VSIRYQADNDLNQLIVAATFRREPGIDFKTAQSAELDRLDDVTVLRRVASEGRILVSHDNCTMPRHFVVETLVLIWADNTPENWQNAITIIPF